MILLKLTDGVGGTARRGVVDNEDLDIVRNGLLLREDLRHETSDVLAFVLGRNNDDDFHASMPQFRAEVTCSEERSAPKIALATSHTPFRSSLPKQREVRDRFHEL